MNRADESRAGEVATAIILSPSVAAIAVALRIYTRAFLVGVRFLEDYCIGLAMVRMVFRLFLVSRILTILGKGFLCNRVGLYGHLYVVSLTSDSPIWFLTLLAVLNGFGRHIETVSSAELVQQGKVRQLAKLAQKAHLTHHR